MKIVVLDGNAFNPDKLSWDCFSQFGEVVVYDRTPEHLTRQRIADAQAVGTIAKALGMEVLAYNRSRPEGEAIDTYISLETLLAQSDVVSCEPTSQDNPLLTAPNCITTPHIAWAPTESRQRIIDCTVRSIQGFLDGNPVNTVNM